MTNSKKKCLNVLDLFTGIGGFSLGLERAGMKTVAMCEIESYPRKVLKKHWPNLPIFEDVRKLNKEVLINEGIRTIDVVCGGFPCQPFSVAGKQRGKEDDRHLWPEMFRIIKETKPRWVIGENVAGFIEMALDDVSLDLESEGYEVQSFIIPACAVGGQHRRDRVWIVANTRGIIGRYSEQQVLGSHGKGREEGIRPQETNKFKGSSKPQRFMADSNYRATKRQRQHGNEVLREKEAVRHNGFLYKKQQKYRPIGSTTEPPVRDGVYGLPESMVRLKALGNAVVPQIPEIIGRAIMKIEMNLR